MKRPYANEFVIPPTYVRKRIRVVSLVAIALFMAGIVIAFRQSAQETKTADTIVKYWKDRCPIDIRSFNIGSQEYEFNKSFRSSHEWFKDISFNLENNTLKTISYVDVAVTFMPPQDAKKVLPFRIEIWQGRRMDALARRDSGLLFAPSLNRPPEERPSLTLRSDNPDREYNLNRSSLDRLGFPLFIREVQVQVQEVVFSDGLMWSAGHWYKLDPGGSQKLVLVDEEGNELKGVALFPLRWNYANRTADDGDPVIDENACYDTIIGYKTCGGRPPRM